MAASSSDTSRPNKPDDYDSRLDFLSDKFDPLFALNTPGLKPPIANAKTYDNVAKYTSVYNNQAAKPKAAIKPGSEPVGKEDAATGSSRAERRWLPHQCEFAGVTFGRGWGNHSLFLAGTLLVVVEDVVLAGS